MNYEIIATFLLPVYNGEDFIRETIESILSQTFKDFELLIIDDGSTDNTHNIINEIQDSRIKLVKNADNLGLIRTLNKGLKLSKGKYILRIDADDICYPSRLEKQISYMEKNDDIVICGGNAKFVYDNKSNVWSPPTRFLDCKTHLLFGNCFVHSSIVLRRSFFEKYDYKYELAYKHAEDFALWNKIVRNKFKVANIKDVLVDYRIHDNNISSYAEAAEQERFKVLSSIYEKNFVKYSDKVTEEILYCHFKFSSFERDSCVKNLNLNVLFVFYLCLIKNSFFKNDFSIMYFKKQIIYLIIKNILKGRIDVKFIKFVPHIIFTK